MGVGVDAYLARDRQRALDDLARAEVGGVPEGPGGGQRVRASGSDREDAVVGLDDLAVPRNEQARLPVGDRQHRLEVAQDLVGAPLLGELDRGPGQVRWPALDLLFELLEQREGVGRRAREAGDDPTVVHLADLDRAPFHHRVAERYLAVSTKGDGALPADRADRGGLDPGLIHRAPGWRFRHADGRLRTRP